MSDDSFLEIERKWVLRALPARIAGFESGQDDAAIDRVRLRQGYLRPATDEEIDALTADSAPMTPLAFGRIRAIESESGTTFVHTVKSGEGLVRREVERAIDAATFEAAWPATVGRRLEKIRWRVRESDGRLWEVDRFEGLDLVLAEVEAPDEATAAAVRIPDWLAPVIDREVTHDPAFTNAEIALRLIADGEG